MLNILLWLLGGLLLIAFIIYLGLERSIWPHKSTWDFFRLSDMPMLKKLEGYFYASRPDLYLKPVTWSWVLKLVGDKENGDPYHGKVLVMEDAARIITLDQPVNRDLEHILPYPMARNLILNHPLPSVGVMECPCRAQTNHPCPRDVCLVVGEPFVTFIVEHNPGKARRLTVDEALKILAEEEERGHIHTAWFKEVMHDRFYTICNCCSCCCLGMQSHNRGVPRIAHSGYRPLLNTDSCAGCRICADTCPFTAMAINGMYPQVDYDTCMGCGVCISHCPTQSLTLELAPEKGLPLNVHQWLEDSEWQPVTRMPTAN